MASNLVGLDIGSSSFKMAYIDGSTVQLVSARLPENMVDKGRIVAPQAMAEFIKATKQEHKITAKGAALVLPATLSFFRHINIPAMTQAQLKLNLPYEFRDYISGEADDYFYDYAVEGSQLDEEGRPQSFDLLAAAVLKSTIAEYRGILRKAGIKLELVLPREMAYAGLLRSYIALNPTAVDQEFCIVDIGTHHTSIDIYKGPTYVASKIAECGCGDIDAVIADVREVDQFVAGTYRETNYEDILSLPECEAVYADIAVEVLRVINFYNFNNPSNTLNDLYYCGVGSVIEPLIEAIIESTSMETHQIKDLFPPEIAEAPDLSTCALAMAMAMAAKE